MGWRHYDWRAIGAGVATLATVLAVLSWAVDPRIGAAVGPVVGGTVTGLLAYPDLFELKHGFLTGAIGSGGAFVAFVGYRLATDPSFGLLYFGIAGIGAAVLVGGGLAAVGAGVSTRGLELFTEGESAGW